MADPKPVSEMTDQELVWEYECVDCEIEEEDERTKALVAEMEARDIGF